MHDIDVALAAARTGAAIVRSAFATGVAAEYKSRHDPVTDVDRAAEQAIAAVLTDHRPEIGILAEEGAGDAASGRRWIVDPLDGTVNFVHGIPQVAVSVALWEDDEPVLGVVLDALRGEEFVAEQGRGMTLDGAAASVSDVAGLENAVVATGFPYDHSRYAAEYVAGVQAVLQHVNGLRRIGSAALDLAWVAAGRFDGYWEMQVAPWDMAAGVVLVEEAGGTATRADGSPLGADGGSILAANGHLHPALLELVAPHIPEHLR